jgi:heme/copper-type cytochrome/quinol oxidase subunit 2
MAMTSTQRKSILTVACFGFVVAVFVSLSAHGQGQVREFSINGNQFAFSPARLEVQKDDLVKITFTAQDMAHSFTVDAYRIAKRAGNGQSVTFEFRADQAGSFPIYCNLAQDERCRNMRGELIVH